MATFAKKNEVKFGGYSTFSAYMQSPEYEKTYIKKNLQFKLRKILKMCVKCDEKVPHSYLCGETDDNEWVYCVKNRWYCPCHSFTVQCDDEKCRCCYVVIEDEDEDL